MRVLAVDFGGVRIGLAVGDAALKLPSSRPPIMASGTLRVDAASISKMAEDEGVNVIVVGEPLDENGEPTKMSKICRKLGAEFAALGYVVNYVDESLTSVAAHGVLREQGLTAAQRRKYVDSEAACRILDRYFAEGGV